jgi:hypothetical protein
MFSWLFKKSNRKLFRFFDGSRLRREDPLALQLKLETHEKCRWDVHPALAEQGDSVAYEICLDAICDVFGVTRFNSSLGTGLTHMELMGLLRSFVDYIEQLKKNTVGSPKSPTTTDAMSPKLSKPTTSDMSDSASTPIESEPEERTLSDTDTKQP